MLTKKENSIKQTIFKRLKECPEHSIYFLNDFVEYVSVETARNNINKGDFYKLKFCHSDIYMYICIVKQE
jgi:hypothetical protein